MAFWWFRHKRIPVLTPEEHRQLAATIPEGPRWPSPVEPPKYTSTVEALAPFDDLELRAELVRRRCERIKSEVIHEEAAAQVAQEIAEDVEDYFGH